jgi:hypothetical protein
MYLVKEGDQSEAICRHCKTLVTTHFKVRTYRLVDREIDIPGMLVGVCDECDSTVMLPAQSSPRIGEALQQRKEETLEARIPTHLEDVIHLMARTFEAPIQTFRPSVLRFYLRELAGDAEFAERVHMLARSDLARAPGRARISLRVPEPLLAEARERARRMGIETDAQMLRGILLAAKEDVLDGGNPERILRLGGAAQAEGAACPRPPKATAARGRASRPRR